METYYAPPHRVERRILLNQIQSVCSSPVMDTLLKAANGLMAVINDARQVVALNHSFLQNLGIDNPEEVLGLRLGEILHCKHAASRPHGCGTTPYCSSCGAVIAMMTSIDRSEECERVCALTTKRNGRETDVCLLVRTQPLMVEGSRWILIYAQDVTRQHFWASLEKVFFHDLNNMIGAMKNYSAYLHDQMPVNPLSFRQKMLAERMVQEVKLQSKLANVKSTELFVNAIETNLARIRNQSFNIVLVSNAMDGKTIKEDGPKDKFIFRTDEMLVSRVLTNMLLNALEATQPGGQIIFRTMVKGSQITWQVWNNGVIPEKNQLRIFQRYFTTKSGHGYGIGTYAMKLFGEVCLGGKVSFTSREGEGTTFTFSLAVA